MLLVDKKTNVVREICLLELLDVEDFLTSISNRNNERFNVFKFTEVDDTVSVSAVLNFNRIVIEDGPEADLDVFLCERLSCGSDDFEFI